MSLYALISSVLSYVFTTVIYLFIFSIIVLIYRDIKKVSRNMDEPDDYDEDGEEYEDGEADENDEYGDEDEQTAILKTVINKESKRFNLRKRYRIGRGPVIVGRSDECDIVIPDVYLSQEHFEIGFKSGEWYVKDLKSRNGTFVNDVPVKNACVLDDGDVISFGDIEFVFNIE